MLSGICTPWLGRGTWLPPDNSLTPPIREHSLPTPCFPPILSRRGSCCQEGVWVPKSRPKGGQTGSRQELIANTGGRYITSLLHPPRLWGSVGQRGRRAVFPGHSFLDVHQVSDFKAFLPGLGTVLVSISKTALNLNTQKQQEVGFFPHTEVFGHMFDVRLFCLQSYSPGRKG